MPFSIIRQDITQMRVDAIVNAANTHLLMGGGVCGAIFKAAGARELQLACDALSPVKTGCAVITPGFELKAKYIIHAVGPVYQRNNPQSCEKDLRSAYLNSLQLALENGCESIAFPLISSGIFGYPKADAMRVASAAIQDFLASHDMDIYLAVFDKNALAISEELLGSVERYIDENYVEKHRSHHRELLTIEQDSLAEADMYMAPMAPKACTIGSQTKQSIDDFMGNLDEPFSQTLVRLIDAKRMTDVEVYKRANIDRKLFSKIRIGTGYMPSKRTVVALAIALRLDLPETEEFLKKAGFALTHSLKFDVIVEYFILQGQYDIFAINEVLYRYDQPLLGA